MSEKIVPMKIRSLQNELFTLQARGKSGPLFQFDASDDVRLVNDATQEKQDSHAGKVLLR